MSSRAVLAVLLIATVWLCAGCEQRWSGFAYPNRFELSRNTSVGTFSSLEDCRRASQAILRTSGSDPFNGDYECGLN
jgi:hypothetical protein